MLVILPGELHTNQSCDDRTTAGRENLISATCDMLSESFSDDPVTKPVISIVATGSTVPHSAASNESVFRPAHLTISRTGKRKHKLSIPPPSILPSLRSGQMRLVIARPICCVYDSFVYSVVHIGAQGDWGGGRDSSEVISAKPFVSLFSLSGR